MDQNNLQEYLNIAIDLAKKSGQMIIEWQEKGSFRVDTKTNAKDLVTEVDIKIERFIFDSLREHYPTHRFIGEESMDLSCKKLDNDLPTWIVDPIDGTMNFAHFSQWCCVSIGLAINQELVLGVIYSPGLNKLYHAVKGQGAFCNGQPIHVSTRADQIENALVLSDIPIGIVHPKYRQYGQNLFENLYWKCQGLRSIGSCCIAMCFIADGSADVFFHGGVKIWDMAAGYVIVREAGGFIYKMNGEPFDPNGGNLLTSGTDVLAKQVVEILIKAKK